MKKIERKSVYGASSRVFLCEKGTELRRSLVADGECLLGRTSAQLTLADGSIPSANAEAAFDSWEPTAVCEGDALWLANAALYEREEGDPDCGQKKGDQLLVPIGTKWWVKGKAVAPKILTLEDRHHGLECEDEEEDEDGWDFKSL